MSAIDQYYVIGNPVKHSLSPKIHQQFAEQTGQTLNYQTLELSVDDFESEFQKLKDNPNVKGLSVTVPFKEQTFLLMDECDAHAKKAKAVSNVIFTKDRKAKGLNLDGIGFVQDLLNHQPIKDKNILVLGAGGAVKGCLDPLISQSPNSITIANRTLSKAEALQKIYQGIADLKVTTYENICDQYDLVINATSASINQTMLPISSTIFSEQGFGYDLMYAPQGTVFTKWCQKNNIPSIDGKGMLIELSAIIFEMWRGVKPDTNQLVI